MAKKLSLFVGRQPSSELINSGLPEFRWEELCDKEEIGRGSFGAVFTAKSRGEIVVIKKLLRQNTYEKRLFLKEAKILNDLSNDHIVRLKGFCPNPLAMMLEYLYFDLGIFGVNGHRLSSLQDFLEFVSTDEQYIVGFSCLHTKIAEDVALGVKYLHENDIVHRDLKPGNVLISNQHYSNMDEDGIKDAWSRNGIVCKLVDFGESRSPVQQTNTICHTMTNNVDRGTIVFMAPEHISWQSVPQTLSLADLKKGDIWSLGMIMFMLLNPDLEFPFQIELDQLQSRNLEEFKKELARRFMQEMKPTFSDKHSILQATTWLKVDEIYSECTKFVPSDRLTAQQIVARLQAYDHNHSISRNIPLSVSQSTAVEDHDKLVAVGVASWGNIPNDATNGCALLAVGIADQLIQELRIVKGMLFNVELT